MEFLNGHEIHYNRYLKLPMMEKHVNTLCIDITNTWNPPVGTTTYHITGYFRRSLIFKLFEEHSFYKNLT